MRRGLMTTCVGVMLAGASATAAAQSHDVDAVSLDHVTLASAAALARSLDTEAVSLDEVVRAVRDRSPTARALRSRIAVADADAEVAGAYPNPELGYQFMGRFTGTSRAINATQHTPYVEIPLLLADQNGARRAAAEGDAQVTRAEVELALLALEVSARRAFVELLSAQDRVARFEVAREALHGLSRLVRQRAGAGAESRYDEMRVGLEITKVEADLASAKADATAARGKLAALAGRPEWQPRAAGTLDTLRTRLRQSGELPAVRAAERRVEAAELDVTRAERERVPEVRLALGGYFTSSPDSTSAYAQIRMPLPIFDDGSAAVSRATAARDAADEARESVEQQAHARLRGLLETLRRRREALEHFDAETRESLPALQEMAAAAYRLGRSGVLELLDAFRAHRDLELTRIDLLARVIHAETDLLAVTGH